MILNNEIKFKYFPLDYKIMSDWVLDKWNSYDPNDPKRAGRTNSTTYTTRHMGAKYDIDFDVSEFRKLRDFISGIGDEFGIKDSFINDMWVNYNPPGFYNVRHYHRNSIISGCYYIDVPENSGGIEFLDGRIFYPKAGDLLLWDSILPHWPQKNRSEYPRFCVPFNISNEEKYNGGFYSDEDKLLYKELNSLPPLVQD